MRKFTSFLLGKKRTHATQSNQQDQESDYHPRPETNYLVTRTNQKMNFKHILLSSSHTALIRSICIWRGFIATAGADHTIKIWTQEGEFLCTLSGHSYWVNTVTAWDDILVSGSYDQTIKFWKLKEEAPPVYKITDKDFECTRDFKGHEGYVLSSVVWNGQLFTGGADKCIKSWDKQGNMTYCIKAHGDGIRFMMVFQNCLWTASNDKTLKQWSKKDSELVCEKTFEGHNGYLNWICTWRKKRIASASHDKTVRVWDLDGSCLFTFDTLGNISWSVTEWMGKLVAGTSNEAKNPHIFIWNWDGSIFQSIPTTTTSALFVCQNKLWQGSDGPIRIWLEPRDWKIERLIWIAWKKNAPENCYLATLPKELVLEVISFLYA